jgi:RNA polymerase sigma factor (sigma-70 family)
MPGSSNDPQAWFDELYRSTRTDILAYLLRRAASPDDAADALADTYLIAWEKLESIPAGGHARLWLFGVAHNILLRGVERRHGNVELVKRITTELRLASTTDPSDTPDLSRLRGALASLTAIDREILTLAAWEDLAPRQIATVLGVSPNTVRIRLHRARRHVRRRLEITPTAEQPPQPAPLSSRT